MGAREILSLVSKGRYAEAFASLTPEALNDIRGVGVDADGLVAYLFYKYVEGTGRLDEAWRRVNELYGGKPPDSVRRLYALFSLEKLLREYDAGDVDAIYRAVDLYRENAGVLGEHAGEVAEAIASRLIALELGAVNRGDKATAYKAMEALRILQPGLSGDLAEMAGALVDERIVDLLLASATKDWARAVDLLRSLSPEESKALATLLSKSGVDAKDYVSTIVYNYVASKLRAVRSPEELAEAVKPVLDMLPEHVRELVDLASVVAKARSALARGDLAGFEEAVKGVNPRVALGLIVMGLEELGDPLKPGYRELLKLALRYASGKARRVVEEAIEVTGLPEAVSKALKEDLPTELAKALVQALKEALEKHDTEELARLLSKYRSVLEDVEIGKGVSLADALGAVILFVDKIQPLLSKLLDKANELTVKFNNYARAKAGGEARLSDYVSEEDIKSLESMAEELSRLVTGKVARALGAIGVKVDWDAVKKLLQASRDLEKIYGALRAVEEGDYAKAMRLARETRVVDASELVAMLSAAESIRRGVPFSELECIMGRLGLLGRGGVLPRPPAVAR